MRALLLRLCSGQAYGVRLAINRREQGQKGVSSEPDGVTRRASGYTVLVYSASVDNESEGVYVRVVMRNVPRLAGENLP